MRKRLPVDSRGFYWSQGIFAILILVFPEWVQDKSTTIEDVRLTVVEIENKFSPVVFPIP